MEHIGIETITVLSGTAKDGRPEPFDELTIRAGDTISIVGPTGSGKSALINDIEVFAREDTVTGRVVPANGEAPPEPICRDPANRPIAMAQTSTCLADPRVRQLPGTNCAPRSLGAGRGVAPDAGPEACIMNKHRQYQCTTVPTRGADHDYLCCSR